MMEHFRLIIFGSSEREGYTYCFRSCPNIDAVVTKLALFDEREWDEETWHWHVTEYAGYVIQRVLSACGHKVVICGGLLDPPSLMEATEPFGMNPPSYPKRSGQ